MRCSQPFVSITSRWGKPTVALRLLGLADPNFHARIANKYRDPKLRGVQFPALILLKGIKSPWGLFQTTQIVENYLTSTVSSTTQINLSYKISVFWNLVFQRPSKEHGEGRIQDSLTKGLTFSLAPSMLLDRTLRFSYRQLVTSGFSSGFRIQDRRLGSGKSQPQTSQLAEFTFSPVIWHTPSSSAAFPLSSRVWPQALTIQKYPNISPLWQIGDSRKNRIPARQSLSRRIVQNLIGKLLNRESMGSQPSEKETTDKSQPQDFQEVKFTFSSVPLIPPSQTLQSRLHPMGTSGVRGKTLSRGQSILRPNSTASLTERPLLIHSATIHQIAPVVEQVTRLNRRLETIARGSILQHREVNGDDIDAGSLDLQSINTRRFNRQGLRVSRLTSIFNPPVLELRNLDVASSNQTKHRDHFYSSVPPMEFARSQVSPSPIPTKEVKQAGGENNFSKLRQADLAMPMIDVTRLADQVYEVIERKIKLERERRGL